MTSSSDRPARAGSLYARFIPREELTSFQAWMPGSFEPPKPVAAAPVAPPPPPDVPPAVHAAALAQARAEALEQGRAEGQRQGYEDGYRDGLAALESFKQHHGAQMAAQVGALLHSIDAQFQALEGPMAQSVAATATRLARAVLRAELSTRPEVVTEVALEAVGAMLAGARQLRVLVHPEDEPLVQTGAGMQVEARGGRVLASTAISRGGCVVESELGRVDARIEQRWAVAAQLLGEPLPWEEPAAPAAPAMAAPARAAAAAVPAPVPAQEPEIELELLAEDEAALDLSGDTAAAAP